MSFSVTGKIIEAYREVQVNERFRKREFILEITDDSSQYPQFAKFQLSQERCELLNNLKRGDILEVEFTLRGRSFEKEGRKTYFTHLEATSIQKD